MINSNIAEGSWNKVKGEILKTWGKLTEDEVNEAKGNILSLAGTLQKKFGVAQEEAREKLNSIIDSVTDKKEKPEEPYADNFDR